MPLVEFRRQISCRNWRFIAVFTLFHISGLIYTIFPILLIFHNFSHFLQISYFFIIFLYFCSFGDILHFMAILMILHYFVDFPLFSRFQLKCPILAIGGNFTFCREKVQNNCLAPRCRESSLIYQLNLARQEFALFLSEQIYRGVCCVHPFSTILIIFLLFSLFHLFQQNRGIQVWAENRRRFSSGKWPFQTILTLFINSLH